MATIVARIILGVYRLIPESIRLSVLLIAFVIFQIVVFKVFGGPGAKWYEIVAIELIVGLPLGYIVCTGAGE